MVPETPIGLATDIVRLADQYGQATILAQSGALRPRPSGGESAGGDPQALAHDGEKEAGLLRSMNANDTVFLGGGTELQRR